jgi:hypothetical protein
MNKKLMNFVSELPGWLSLEEGKFLEQSVNKNKKLKGAVVEIGSFCGKSTIWLAQSESKVYAIDPHKGQVESGMEYPQTYNKFITNLKAANVYSNVQPIVKTSQKASKNWDKDIKVLFIDGLHDEKNAQADFILWSKFLVKEGIVLIHDSYKRWCGSEKVAIKYILNSPDFYKIGTVGTITYGIKGKGNLLDYFQKSFIRSFLLVNIYISRSKTVICNLPQIIKTKMAIYLFINVPTHV